MEIIKLVKRFRTKIDKFYSNKEKKNLEPYMLASIMKNIFDVERYWGNNINKGTWAMADLFKTYVWLLCYYKLDLNVIKFEFTKDELDNFSWYWLLERFGKNLKKYQEDMVFDKKEFRDDFNNQKLYYKEQFFEYLNLYLSKKVMGNVKEQVINWLEYGIQEPTDCINLIHK